MYNKRCMGVLLAQKAEDTPQWVKWIHEPTGIFHCPECLKLHERWFVQDKAPFWPHHENCHCRLEKIDYLTVLMNAVAYSDFTKFDPYLFDPTDFYKHGKGKMFESWGYTIADARWLQEEMERQALEKYISGEYTLGKLNAHGQRISIIIEIPNRTQGGTVSFVSGWMVQPNGKISLNTPYGGK